MALTVQQAHKALKMKKDLRDEQAREAQLSREVQKATASRQA